MPSRPQDHVHRLIRSMTRAEKRYFKLYCTRHSAAAQGNHSELFDAIGNMAEYDEQRLREQFEGAGLMRRFAITKRRLYEAILNSLDAFHAESSIDDKLRRLLHHVEILHNKALYADAAKVLQSVRTLARAHDRQALLLLVAEWDRKLMERGNYADITAKQMDDRALAVGGLLQEWLEVEKLWQTKSHLFLLLYRSGQTPDPDELHALNQIAQGPLLADDSSLHTARARFLHHHVRGALAYAHNDLTGCAKELTACAEVLRQESVHFQAEPDLLLGVMGNLAHVRMRMGMHQQALDGFREFRKIPLMLAVEPSPDLKMKLFVMGSSLELSVLAAKGDFTIATERLADLEEGLERYAERTSSLRRAELELQAAYSCFGDGKHERALRWCNRMLGEPGIDVHTEVHALGRIMNILVLVELGKKELLEYIIRNTKRYLKQHGAPFAMETRLINHVQALSKVKQSPAKYALWAKFATDLAAMASEKREAVVLDHMDMLSWAQGKADDKPFGELVRGKWHARSRGGKATGAKRAA